MSEILIPFRLGLKGEFRYNLRDANGNSYAGWSPWDRNTILNQGLDFIGGYNITGSESPFDFFHIGTSNATEAVTQTGLISWLASSNSSTVSDVREYSGATEYTKGVLRTRRFNAGVGVGTIQEMGTSNAFGNTNIYCRHVITPGIPKDSEQILDLQYRHTVYPMLTDYTAGTVTLDGDVYDVIVRMSNVGETDDSLNGAMRVIRNSTQGEAGNAYTGDIGATTGIPTGLITGTPDITDEAYGLSNHYRDQLVNADPEDWVGDIRSVVARFQQYQIQARFGKQGGGDEAITKTGNQRLKFFFRCAWARHP